MGSIPLVALMGQQYQPESLLSAVGKAQAIKSSQQQQEQSAALLPGELQQQNVRTQLGQQAVQSGALDLAQRKAINDAWKQAVTPDPTTGMLTADPNKLQSALAASGHGEAIPAITKGLMDMQNTAGELAAQKSSIASAEQDAAGDGAQAVLASGLDPNVKNLFFQHMQSAGYGAQAQQLQQHLAQFQNNPQAETQIWKALVAQSPKQQALATEAATAAAKTSEAATQAKKEQFEESMGGTSPDMMEMKSYLQNNPGKTPQDFAEWKAKIVPAFNFNLQNSGATGPGGKPSVMAQGLADGSIKWQDVVSNRTPIAVKQQILSEVKSIDPNFNSGDYSIEQGVKKEFTSGDAAKNLTAFNTAIEHAGQLRQAADALDNGDVRGLNAIGNQLGYQFGNDKTTNFNVIKNALSGEISKVFKGGQATDAEIKQVEQPFSSANSPAQLKGAIDNAVALMNSKRNALQQQYQAGIQAKPNFGGGNQEQPQHTPGGKAQGLTEGSTGKGSDGKKYVVKGGIWVPK